jgi:hypothetical protein
MLVNKVIVKIGFISWQPLMGEWEKLNTDDGACKERKIVACGGLIRDNDGLGLLQNV